MTRFEWIDIKRDKPQEGQLVAYISDIGGFGITQFVEDYHNHWSWKYWFALPSKPNNEQSVKECDASKADSSNSDGHKKPLTAEQVLEKHLEQEWLMTTKRFIWDEEKVLAAMEEYKNQGADIEGLREKFFKECCYDTGMKYLYDSSPVFNLIETYQDPQDLFNWFKTNLEGLKEDNK